MRQPFFVVGLMRSGTTLLYRLLVDHPRIALTNEARVVDFLAQCCRHAAVPFLDVEECDFIAPVELHGLVQAEHTDLFAEVFRKHAVAALEEFYARRFAGKQFTHWGEKLPSAQAAIELQSVYPHARYVILVRDPRDGWCSFDDYREREQVPPALLEHTPERYGRTWTNVHANLEKYLEHRLSVRYEDLVRAPRRVVGEVLDFLGLDGADELVRALDTERSFTGHGSSRSPAASIGRWRRDLDQATVAQIERHADEAMRRRGYEPAGG